MSYYAIIKLEDMDSNDVRKFKGEAVSSLLEAIQYIKVKDGSSGFLHKLKKAGNYLAKDFEEFEKFLKEPIKWKK